MQNHDVVRAIADNAAARPEKTIFRFLDRGEVETCAYTYLQLDEKARRVAGGLIDRGLAGEPVLLVFEPGADFVVALLGCLYAGAVAVPAPAPRRGASLDRLEGIARTSRARLVIAGQGVAVQIAAGSGAESALTALTLLTLDELSSAEPARACPGLDRQPRAPLLIQYTSGSTLAPRGVVLDSACVSANVAYACRGIGFGTRGEDVFVNWMPHYHDMGLIGNMLLPLAMGHESIHMAPVAFVQQPSRWLQAVTRYRATASGGPPLAYDACVARVSDETLDALNLSSWRIAFCGAEPVFARSLDAFRSRFRRAGLPSDALLCVYGMAELAVYAAGSPRPAEAQQGARGADGKTAREPCFLDAEAREALRIVSERGEVVPEGSEGEIWISHASVAPGYLHDPEASAATFGHRLVPDDGRSYLRTGDLGALSGGALSITGRIKDVLIRNGANFAACDVERLAAAGRPPLDPNSCAAFQGEGAASPIVLLLEKPRFGWDPAAEADLTREVRASVMAGLGLALDHVVFVEAGALPRTTSGKIQRGAARGLWEASRAAALVAGCA